MSEKIVRWPSSFGLATKTATRVALLSLWAAGAFAQFKSTAPLVLAPTTVRDAQGNFVDGLNQQDLVLYDNNVVQAIQMDWTTYPIDLVVGVQTSANSGPIIDKLGGAGILFTQLLAAEAGQTAIVTFSGQTHLRQDFTSDPDAVTHALQMLRVEGGVAASLDALRECLTMLERRPANRRRIVLLIAEKRDRGSKAQLNEVMERVQRLNATVYWLTYSPLLQQFTVKPKTVEDAKPEAERIKVRKCDLCPDPDNRGVPPDYGPGGYLYALGELVRLHQPDLSELFPNVTGGRTLNFLKKSALEEAIQSIGEEVHRQYIASFAAKSGDSDGFHAIRIVVKDRPDLRAKTRLGYWPLP